MLTTGTKRFVLKRIETTDRERVREVRKAYRLLDRMPLSGPFLRNRFWTINSVPDPESAEESSYEDGSDEDESDDE
jgi:hypothetical protein